MSSGDSLQQINERIEQEILRKKEEVQARRKERGYVKGSNYFVVRLDGLITTALNHIAPMEDIGLEFIDRKRFGADVAVKIPKFLKEKGAGDYMKEVVPQIVSAIENCSLRTERLIVSVEAMNIYVNLLLDDNFLLQVLNDIPNLKDRYGELDYYEGRKIVIDYSSPNMAKHLHPGHIRSTIAGEVLSNLYEAVGYTVHRLNYLNDWGGIAFIIEGYIHWKDSLPSFENKNDLLYTIYLIYRKAEQTASDEKFFNNLNNEDRASLLRYFGPFDTFGEFKDKYSIFVKAASDRFGRLEAGDDSEITLWSQMREWSISEFAQFYELLGINHDYVIGESFYASMGKEVIKNGLAEKKIVIFDEEKRAAELKEISRELKSGKISQEVFESLSKEIDRDLDAYVVMLDYHKRLVVARKDGSTIYATRDLAGVKHKVMTFDPNRLIYETGEEQAGYFEGIFEAAKRLGFCGGGGDVDLIHLHHGMYIDSKTKKKLSSRQGSASVLEIINKSVEYFRKKYEERDQKNFSLTNAEKDINAKMIAVGSIVYNDIKQERRFPISIHRDALENIKEFEESGGAYIMYSSARAKSILRKSKTKIDDLKLDKALLVPEELTILKMLAEFPRIILRAAEYDNASVLANYLLTLANEYNGYYEKHRVLNEVGKAEKPLRLSITSAVAQILSNGLALCHAPAPEII